MRTQTRAAVAMLEPRSRTRERAIPQSLCLAAQSMYRTHVRAASTSPPMGPGWTHPHVLLLSGHCKKYDGVDTFTP
jgi:hypothetical protein